MSVTTKEYTTHNFQIFDLLKYYQSLRIPKYQRDFSDVGPQFLYQQLLVAFSTSLLESQFYEDVALIATSPFLGDSRLTQALPTLVRPARKTNPKKDPTSAWSPRA